MNNIIEDDKKEIWKKAYIFIIIGISIILVFISVFFLRIRRKKILEKSIKSKIFEKKSEIKTLETKVNPIFDEIVEMAKQDNPDFLTKFSEVYPELISRLKTGFPELTTSQLKLLAFCYLNFSTKDIAIYTQTTIRSVQTTKYRVRKILRIDSDIDLNEWIRTLQIS